MPNGRVWTIADDHDDTHEAPRDVRVDTILLRRAAGLFEGEIDASDAAQLQNAGHALKAVLEQAAEMQRNLDIMLSDLGIKSASKDLIDQTAFQPGTVFGRRNGHVHRRTCTAFENNAP